MLRTGHGVSRVFSLYDKHGGVGVDTDGGTCEVQAGDQGTAVCGDHMQGRQVRWWGCRGGNQGTTVCRDHMQGREVSVGGGGGGGGGEGP